MPRRPPPSCYVIDYAGQFGFAAPPEEVWAAMARPEAFERWWGWLGGMVVHGDGLAAGTVLRFTVSPPLPYRMRVDVELDRCEPPRRIDATVRGDLVGEGRLSLGDGAGGGTSVEVAWTVEMTQRPMRVAARVAHPLLRWGHDMVVDATVRGFGAQLRS